MVVDNMTADIRKDYRTADPHTRKDCMAVDIHKDYRAADNHTRMDYWKIVHILCAGKKKRPAYIHPQIHTTFKNHIFFIKNSP